MQPCVEADRACGTAAEHWMSAEMLGVASELCAGCSCVQAGAAAQLSCTGAHLQLLLLHVAPPPVGLCSPAPSWQRQNLASCGTVALLWGMPALLRLKAAQPRVGWELQSLRPADPPLCLPGPAGAQAGHHRCCCLRSAAADWALHSMPADSVPKAQTACRQSASGCRTSRPGVLHTSSACIGSCGRELACTRPPVVLAIAAAAGAGTRSDVHQLHCRGPAGQT